MGGLLEGKLGLVLGIANRWSLAYAIAQAFSREGATLVLTYLGEHQKDAVESLAKDLNVARFVPCNVTLVMLAFVVGSASLGAEISAARLRPPVAKYGHSYGEHATNRRSGGRIDLRNRRESDVTER